MAIEREVNSQGSLETGEKVSADRGDTFSDLEKFREAIQVEDDHFRCRCEWDYATGNGTQRGHNPLCPVHDRQHVLDATGTQGEQTSK